MNNKIKGQLWRKNNRESSKELSIKKYKMTRPLKVPKHNKVMLAKRLTKNHPMMQQM